MPLQRLGSICSVGIVGLACKAFLKFGCKSVAVDGFHHLKNALADDERKDGRGVVTVSNHISTADDPLTWGALPVNHYFNLRNMRWALGAHDIIFTNPFFSAFFRSGQVLETFRGAGVYQKAVDTAIKRLNEGDWVHLFGEGKVNQPYQYELLRDSAEVSSNELVARLPRFKWGTGRIVMEPKRIPVIIPMWLSGFEHVRPEPALSGLTGKYLPRSGQNIKITFGPPLDNTELQKILDASAETEVMPSVRASGVDDTARTAASSLARDGVEERRKREAVTAVLQRAVEQLGYRTSGMLLGRPHEEVGGPKVFTPR